MGKHGASSPSSGFNASTFMYGFIFMMYAVVACVLFWLMANRWVPLVLVVLRIFGYEALEFCGPHAMLFLPIIWSSSPVVLL